MLPGLRCLKLSLVARLLTESRMMGVFRMIILMRLVIILRLRMRARDDETKKKLDFYASEEAADSIILAASWFQPLDFRQLQCTSGRNVIPQSSEVANLETIIKQSYYKIPIILDTFVIL